MLTISDYTSVSEVVLSLRLKTAVSTSVPTQFKNTSLR